MDMSPGVLVMGGVRTRAYASETYNGRNCAIFCVATETNPDIHVRGDANILNKHAIHRVVLNILTICITAVVFV